MSDHRVESTRAVGTRFVTTSSSASPRVQKHPELPASTSFRRCSRAVPSVRSQTTPAVSRADLVVVGKKARRSSGYWSAGSFAAALGKAVKSPTIAIPSGLAQPAESGTPFRNILSAIDFSEVSFRALSEALALAQQSGGHLRLLHVLDGFPYETVYSGSRAFRLMHDFRARVARVNRELQSLIPPDALNWSEIEVATVSGEAHEAILAAASERRTDLIVLGLPRRPRLEQFVAGSTVHRVLRRATSPVLLVPGPSTASLFRPADEHDGQFARYPSAPKAAVSERVDANNLVW